MQTTLVLVIRYALICLLGVLAGYSIVHATRGEWLAAIYFVLCAILAQVVWLSAPNASDLAKADLARQKTHPKN